MPRTWGEMPRTWLAGQGLVEYGFNPRADDALHDLILGVFGGTVADILGVIGTAIDAATGGS